MLHLLHFLSYHLPFEMYQIASLVPLEVFPELLSFGDVSAAITILVHLHLFRIKIIMVKQRNVWASSASVSDYWSL